MKKLYKLLKLLVFTILISFIISIIFGDQFDIIFKLLCVITFIICCIFGFKDKEFLKVNFKKIDSKYKIMFNIILVISIVYLLSNLILHIIYRGTPSILDNEYCILYRGDFVKYITYIEYIILYNLDRFVALIYIPFILYYMMCLKQNYVANNLGD